MTQPSVTVECVVVLDADAPSFSAATLLVRVDDVSYADAPQAAYAITRVARVAHQQGRASSWMVLLSCPQPDPRRHFSLWAHLDLDGDEQVSRGDYITMESYPVLTFGYPDSATVRLRRVG